MTHNESVQGGDWTYFFWNGHCGPFYLLMRKLPGKLHKKNLPLADCIHGKNNLTWKYLFALKHSKI